MTRYGAAGVVLTLVYALALGSFHPRDLLIGVGLSAVLLFASRRFVFGSDGTAWRPAGSGLTLLGRVVAFVPFSAAVLREILVGTWEVALVTLRLRPLVRPGIVAVPLGNRTPTGVAVWAMVTGLPPGSFFVDVDRERGVVLIHVLDARDPEVFRRQQEDFYRRYQSKVFP
ncbi:MAG: Na+/H+ antiporter subunit E [Actinomycetota bacterium]|jgi:multicomponent Na+:H+ antiporter subunit E|nr:Na+/H+ antiporter subunit E [Actinomycetota bacterium]